MRFDIRRGLWLGAALLLLAAPLFADQPMSSANYSLWRNAADGGGHGAGSGSYISTGAVAEQPIAVVNGSTSSSSNFALGPGLMNIMYFPGRIMTLSVSASTNIFITSATLQWNTTGYDGSVGNLMAGSTYFIRLATYPVPNNFDFADAQVTISTSGPPAVPGWAVNTIPTSLFPNATYYANIWTDDYAGNLSFISNGSTFATGSFPPTLAAPTLTAVWQSSMSAQWLDSSISNNQVNQTTYTIIFSSDASNTGLAVSTNAFSGNIIVSTIAFSTTTQASLYPNTTYFLWARSVNVSGSTSPWVSLGSTSSLTLPVAHLSPYEYQFVFYTSATARWAALRLHPPDASSMTCEGYLLRASTDDFGAIAPGGGVILTSATPAVTASSLTINFALAGLDSYTTWYFQAGALNWNSAWNPVELTRLNMQISQSTFNFTLGSINPGVFQSTVSMSSMVITNVGNIAATYNVWASTVAPCLYKLGTSRGIEQAVLQGQWRYAGGINTGPSSGSFGAIGTNDITVSTATSTGALYFGDQTGVSVPPGQSRTMWFQFWLPGSTADTSTEHIIVGVAPTYP